MKTREALVIATHAINPFGEPISREHLVSYLYLQRYTASLILMRDKDLWGKPESFVYEQHERASKLYKTITRRIYSEARRSKNRAKPHHGL